MKLQDIIKEQTKEYQDHLKALFDETNEDYALFSAVIGDNYPTEENRGIMFYGRATNGWDEKEHDISFVLDYMKSSFFRLMKNIYSHYYHDEADLNYWTKFVGYSNVAKIAPEDSGNPSDEWWDLQYTDLVKILNAELAITSPKVAIFVTGNTASDTWHAPLCNDGGIYTGMKEIEHHVWYNFTTRNGVEKECTATAYIINDTIVIVTDRPEFRDMDSHIKTIISMIDKHAKEV